MLLWNAVDGFTEIDDPFLIKDNEIAYSSQSEYVFPGIDGFTSSIEEMWGGGISSGSSNGIIVNTVETMDTVAITIALPRSIMLYAVDEYLLVDRMTTKDTWYHIVHDNSVKWYPLARSRLYTYGSFIIANVYIRPNDIILEDNLQWTIRYYASDDTAVYTQSGITQIFPKKVFTDIMLNSIYQPVKPSEYPESVYWSFVAFNFDTGIQAYGKPVCAKLVVLYTPTGYDYITT